MVCRTMIASVLWGLVFAKPYVAQPPLPWTTAHELAMAKLSEMTREEKNLLIKAYTPDADNVYVGNVPGVPRVGIPSLNMADAGQGFRVQKTEYVGTATSWPSGLAMGATWNPDLLLELGEALGSEFRGKGANVILGPGLEVQRVARDGRGFEYISGDDPVLGAKLGAKYVEGVQSMGVMAVLKHFALHHQQENNKKESSYIDAKINWELYYPPFEAAIEAGAVAVMSAYSKVNGTWAAENADLLRRDLKGELGFQGLVMSDWGGFNGENAAWHAGCDVDMWASFTHIGQDAVPSQVSEDDINDSVGRILASMYRVHLFESDGCTPPDCDSKIKANVTSEDHTKLSLKAAKESIVLLKNDELVLPLDPSKVKTIALVGSAADAPGIITIDYPSYPFPGDFYAGGGSGHVQTDRFVTPRAGIEAVATSIGVEVLVSASNDIEAAIAQARLADVTIISVGTSSTEDEDRASLDLDDNANKFISAVSKEAKSSVVIVQSPGAFLTPWRDDVQAIAALFLGGQETGHAWGDMLFGKDAPSGRLPIMMPATQDDQITPTSEMNIVYTEGLHTSYRNTEFKAAFSFGHGLTYTTFEFTNSSLLNVRDFGHSDDLDISLNVKNVGVVAARAVPQLYVEFSPVANQPVPLLKSFHKTSILRAGEMESVMFHLSRRDRSYWSPAAGWIMSDLDDLIFHVGASSSDIVLSFSGAGFSPISV